MKRSILMLPAWLFLGAATPASAPQIPDVIAAGRTAATLSDWQTISFFLMFIIVVSVVERIVAAWQYRATARQLADAMDRLGDATQSRATDIKVTLALMQTDLARALNR